MQTCRAWSTSTSRSLKNAEEAGPAVLAFPEMLTLVR
jgi:hypothetical protein